MGIRTAVEIGKQRTSVSLTAAASGNPAGHGAAGCSATFWPLIDARSSSAGFFNWNLGGTFVGTVVVDKTFDDGASWVPASDIFGAAITGTAAKAALMRELEAGVGYRSRCTAYTSGTAVSRLGQ